MSRWGSLPLVLLLLACPICAQSSGAQSSRAPRYLRNPDYMCRATLEDGTAYEEWHRVLAAEWKGQPLYLKLRAYYKPGSGEFLWWHGGGMSEHGYASEPKENPGKWGAPCEVPNDNLWNKHTALLEDGEWADFWASNWMVTVFHSKLKFGTPEKAWSYVAEHWQDGIDGQTAKWVTNLRLYEELGRDFFRPKKLEFDARPYSYDSLISATKVGSNWKVEIKGADEPNRATVMLDSNFKLLELTKNPAPH